MCARLQHRKPKIAFGSGIGYKVTGSYFHITDRGSADGMGNFAPERNGFGRRIQYFPVFKIGANHIRFIFGIHEGGLVYNLIQQSEIFRKSLLEQSQPG